MMLPFVCSRGCKPLYWFYVSWYKMVHVDELNVDAGCFRCQCSIFQLTPFVCVSVCERVRQFFFPASVQRSIRVCVYVKLVYSFGLHLFPISFFFGADNFFSLFQCAQALLLTFSSLGNPSLIQIFKYVFRLQANLLSFNGYLYIPSIAGACVFFFLCLSLDISPDENAIEARYHWLMV